MTTVAQVRTRIGWVTLSFFMLAVLSLILGILMQSIVPVEIGIILLLIGTFFAIIWGSLL